MIRRFSLIVLILFIWVPQAQTDGRINSVPILKNVLKDYIQPSYQNFHKNAEILVDEMGALCDLVTLDNLKSARQSFSEVALAWARIEWLRVGPTMSENRLERILYYPDRKSIGLRQVQRALAAQDKSVLTVETLSRKSVAMQGLGALEYLLFGTDYESLFTSKGDFRCRYGKAISQNINQIALELVSGWQDGSLVATFWTTPNQDNPFYRNDQEALNRLIGTIIHGLEAIRDVRMGYFLRDVPNKDRPKSAVLRRSFNTMPMIAHGILGLEQIYHTSGLAQYLPEDQSSLASSMDFELIQATRTAGSFSGSVADIVADGKARDKLLYLRLALGFAIERLDREFAPALGLKAGFSFGDGD